MTRPTLVRRRWKLPYRDCCLGLSGARRVARHLSSCTWCEAGARSTRKDLVRPARPACSPPRVDPGCNSELVGHLADPHPAVHQLLIFRPSEGTEGGVIADAVDAHLHALGPAAVLRTSVASGHRCVRCVRGESHDRLAVPIEREVGRCVTPSQGCAPSNALRIPLSDVGCPLSVCGPHSVVVMM